MNYEDLADLAERTGFSAWAKLNVASIDLKPEVRNMCAVNSCGMYAKRWSCPPGCGTLEECRTRLVQYSYGILVQTVGEIEDSFDFEAMMDIEAAHKERFALMLAFLRKEGTEVLALGAGCCTYCSQCTYPDAPCRFPDKSVSSMEAYGILVLEVCKLNGLQYHYGSDKMAYTSCFFIR